MTIEKAIVFSIGAIAILYPSLSPPGPSIRVYCGGVAPRSSGATWALGLTLKDEIKRNDPLPIR